MEWTVFKEAVDKTSRYCELYILHASGEPLLNPRLMDMIRYCAAKKVGTWLSTNAMLLQGRIADELLNSPLAGMVIAIDGATKETYEKIRRGGNFEIVIENTRNFLAKKRSSRSKMMVSLQFIIMEENESEVEQFIQQWRKEDVNIIIKPRVNWFAKNINELKYPDVLCDRPWYWMTIKSDGTVPVCADDIGCEYPVGNITSSTLEDLWNSEQMRNFRSLVRGGKQNHPLCSTCDYAPAHPLNFLGLCAYVFFDMLSVAKLLFWKGYKKPCSDKLGLIKR